jgi:hypothetical protein
MPFIFIDVQASPAARPDNESDQQSGSNKSILPIRPGISRKAGIERENVTKIDKKMTTTRHRSAGSRQKYLIFTCVDKL